MFTEHRGHTKAYDTIAAFKIALSSVHFCHSLQFTHHVTINVIP